MGFTALFVTECVTIFVLNQRIKKQGLCPAPVSSKPVDTGFYKRLVAMSCKYQSFHFDFNTLIRKVIGTHKSVYFFCRHSTCRITANKFEAFAVLTTVLRRHIYCFSTYSGCVSVRTVAK